MAFALNTKMDNGGIALAVRPLQPGHVPLGVKGRWPGGAAIARCPLLQPCKNGKQLAALTAVVGNDAVGRSMQLKQRHRSYRMAAFRVGRVGPGDRCEGGQASCQDTRQHIRHASAIGEAGGIDAQWVNAEGALQVSEQITDKQDIVDLWPPTNSGVPAGLTIGADHSLRVDDEKALLIGQEGHARASFLLHGITAVAMKVQHKRFTGMCLIA